jgi:hypothetical protein
MLFLVFLLFFTFSIQNHGNPPEVPDFVYDLPRTLSEIESSGNFREGTKFSTSSSAKSPDTSRMFGTTISAVMELDEVCRLIFQEF